MLLSFAMPLPLGFESEYEAADTVLDDGGFPVESILPALNACETAGFHAFKAAAPREKPGKIAFCRYRVNFFDPPDRGAWKDFLSRGHIPVSKRGKKGVEVTIDAAPKIKEHGFDGDSLVLTLGAGAEYLSPAPLLAAFYTGDCAPGYIITREMLLLDDLTPFT